MGKEYKICPICGKGYTEAPALSRRDNKTSICPECGTREAIEDLENIMKSKEEKE